MDVPFYTKDFIAKATDIFSRANTLATGDEKLLQRVERAELPILYVKCWRGPRFAGLPYAEDLAAFERIGRQVGVKFMSEGRPNFEAVVAKWKQRIPKSATNNRDAASHNTTHQATSRSPANTVRQRPP
jgi:hypothetical protein